MLKSFFHSKKNRSQSVYQDEPNELQVKASLAANIRQMEGLFCDVDTIRCREFENATNPDIQYAIYFFEGITDSNLINEHIIKPLVLAQHLHPGRDLFEQIKDSVVMINEIKETTDISEITEAISYGDTVLFVEGSKKALLLSSKSFALRGLMEPEGERVLSGPREGFTEGLMLNLSLIRRRLLTHHLKMRFFKIGIQSKTSVCIAYMDNIVNKNVLAELYRRLEGIELDAILDSNYLVEYIAESSVLGFNSTGTTERPDVVVGKLMEGRIAMFVDGSPVVITLPYLFIENFQSGEDYYLNPFYASFSRILRMICFFLTCTFPATYIAVVAYHHEVLPSPLMINFAGERTNAPLPAAVECFVMLMLFDILREAGVRMPYHVGQAMSIVGALVIGQSAVEASLVAAPMVIVVAITGITILLVPRLTTTSLFSRYMCILLSSVLGLTGLIVGMAIIVLQILNMESFGVPYTLQTRFLRFQEVKDTFIRAPWPMMLTRTRPLTKNIKRQTPYHPPTSDKVSKS